MDLTHGINPYQSVEGMVHDYEKREAAADAALHDPDECTTPREHMEPARESLDLVRRGRLCADTGAEIPPTSKTRAVQRKQFGTPSPLYLKGYEGIRWDN